MIERDVDLERELTDLAAKAAGFSHDGGLRRLADERAWPGGVREGIDWDEEGRAEAADWASYLLWKMIPVYQAYLDGEPEATKTVERRMRALSHLIAAWHAMSDDR